MSMIERYDSPVILRGGVPVPTDTAEVAAREKTISYRILRAHEKKKSTDGKMRILFDAMISHDITFVGIIQTARASGMKEFPIPYALTNCHNSLCAVGGTINEDDHAFGLSAAMKYGGIYVPPNQAVIHQFAREKLAGCGKMILGSDSHTRYGCYGTMAVGEGGPELAKQLLRHTWDLNLPEVVLVYLTGSPKRGVGLQLQAEVRLRQVLPELGLRVVEARRAGNGEGESAGGGQERGHLLGHLHFFSESITLLEQEHQSGALYDIGLPHQRAHVRRREGPD